MLAAPTSLPQGEGDGWHEVRLEGKRAVIAPPSAGIRRATALAFIAEGDKVFAVDIDGPAMHRIAAAGEIAQSAVDICSDERAFMTSRAVAIHGG